MKIAKMILSKLYWKTISEDKECPVLYGYPIPEPFITLPPVVMNRRLYLKAGRIERNFWDSLTDGSRPGSLRDKMRNKIDTPEGRKMYSKRLVIVEPVFGNIRACKKMDRFTLRGKTKVNIQWLLYCIVHNVENICNYGSNYSIQGT